MNDNNQGSNIPPYSSGAVPPSAPIPQPSLLHKALSVVSSLLLLLIAPVLALFLILFVFQSYEVDGPSMESSLQHQDRLIVLKLPQTMAKIKRKDYIPNRADIIVFNRSETDGESSRQLIKRVIGLPGDRVVIIDNTVTVYNEENPDGFLPDKTLGYTIDKDVVTDGVVDLKIEAGEVFVLGDNRGNSLDSRYFGVVSTKDIVGKLMLRVYPFNKIDKF